MYSFKTHDNSMRSLSNSSHFYRERTQVQQAKWFPKVTHQEVIGSSLVIGLLLCFYHDTTIPGAREGGGGRGPVLKAGAGQGVVPLGGSSCGSHLCLAQLAVLTAAMDILSSTPTCQTGLAELGKHGLRLHSPCFTPDT